MAGLLDPDFVIGRDGMPRRIEQPTDGLLATAAPTWADAWQFNTQAAGDWIDKQRAISAERGLWNPETGLPTAAGVVDAAGQTAQGILMGSTAPKGIRAYHGSPYDFDAFDWNKIGTGEGNQSFGYGHYAAGRESIARGYRDKLTPKVSPEQLNMMDWLEKRAGLQMPEVSGIATASNPRAAAADYLAFLDRRAKGPDRNNPFETRSASVIAAERADWAAQAERLRNHLPLIPETALPSAGRGHMYELNIKADPDHLLSLDHPLSEQPPHVQQALEKLDPNVQERLAYLAENRGMNSPLDSPEDFTGRQLVKMLEHPDVSDAAEEAAIALREAGIPGLKYLDASSRKAPPEEQTHNYVSFHDDQMEILRKYLALLTAGGAGGMAAIGGRE